MIDFESIRKNYQYVIGDVSSIDYLLECESILADTGVYAYKNWYNAEIVEGPIISNYWVDIALMYDADAAPDMSGVRRLDNYGIRYSKRKDSFNETPLPTAEELADNPSEPVESVVHDVVIVTLRFPKRLINSQIREYLNLEDFIFEPTTGEGDDEQIDSEQFYDPDAEEEQEVEDASSDDEEDQA